MNFTEKEINTLLNAMDVLDKDKMQTSIDNTELIQKLQDAKGKDQARIREIEKEALDENWSYVYEGMEIPIQKEYDILIEGEDEPK